MISQESYLINECGLLQLLHKRGHSSIVPDLHRVLLLGEIAGQCHILSHNFAKLIRKYKSLGGYLAVSMSKLK